MAGLFYAARASAQVNHSAGAGPAVARASPQANTRASPNDGPNSGYVGSEACSRCHAGIYKSFSRTRMGQSMTPVTPELLKTLPLSKPIYNRKFDRYYEVSSKDGKFYQSEYQLDATGKEVFRDTHQIDWIVGANAYALSGLTQHDDYLFEAPLSFYARTKTWELSPGYEHEDQAFNRIISLGCIYCHSGRSRPVAGHDGKYENPEFTQLTVGCENCHGPGAAHVQAMSKGDIRPGQDTTIVNPGDLNPALANDICMSCHQTGDARLFQPGKTYLDFRPGEPLDKTVAIFQVPPTREHPPDEDHLEHYYSMSLSKCFRATRNLPDDKQLRCISCHDPHVEPTAAEAPAYFNGKCMACHTATSCKAPAQARQQTAPADNCIGCHMPSREIRAISHSTATNHRIVAQPNEPFPDAAFTMTTPALPDLIYLNAEPGVTAPPAVTLLQAYAWLKDRSPAYEASYLKTLHTLETTEPENALVQAALGHQALGSGKLDEAAGHLQHSLRLNPEQAAVYIDLSSIADQKGDAAGAVALAQKAVALEPFNAPMQKTLVLRLIDAKQYAEAMAAMERYLANFPEDDAMRKMLAMVKNP